MSTNMTRKGLAFGAGFALIGSGLIAAPAAAAGLDDKSFVSLSPETGTEYSVLNTEYFDLKANAASTIASSGNLKFLVEDTAATTKFDIDMNGSTDDVQTSAPSNVAANALGAQISVASLAISSTTATATVSGGHNLANGDVVTIAGATDTDGTDGSAAYNIEAEVTVTSDTVFTYTVAAGTYTVGGTITASNVGAGSSQGSAIQVNGTTVTVQEPAHGYTTGELLTIAGVAVTNSDGGEKTADEAKLNGKFAITVVDANHFTYSISSALDAGTTDVHSYPASVTFNNDTGLSSFANIKLAGLGSKSIIAMTPTVQTTPFSSPSNGRKSSTDGTYIVDSEVASAANDKVLRLININDTTASVNVTAWVDANDNGVIDSTEYTSETRTVQFVKASGLVTSVSITPVAGDADLTAVITTTPTLNGQQMLAQDKDFLNVAFERQGATNTLYSTKSYDNQATDETSAWNDTTKVFTSTIGMDADANFADGADGTADTSWAGLATAAVNVNASITTSVSGSVITVNSSAHGLLVGDKIKFDAAASGSDLLNETFTVTSIVSAGAFTINAASSSPTIGADASLNYIIATWPGSTTQSLADRVFPGTYKAQVSLKGTLVGSKATSGAAIVTSSAVTLSTTATPTVQGLSVSTDTENEVLVKKGTTSVDFNAVVTDANKNPVTAGRTVRVSLEATTGSATAQNGSFKINGASAPATLTTDANGAVSFTLTDATGAATSQVRVTVTAEGTAVAGMDIDWETQAFSLYDMNTSNGALTSDGAGTTDETRTILENGSYQMDLFIADQWYEAAAADKYRVVATGEGVTPGVVPMSNARGTVTITDNAVERANNIDTDLTLQELNADGTVKSSTVYDVETIVAKSTNITLAADGSTLYSPGSNAADLSNAVSAKALVERDIRTENTTKPAYGTGFLRLSGQITNDLNATGLEGAAVTVSGPSNILFAEGSVESRGSLTFTSETNGKFEVLLYSTTAQKDTVITFSALGSTATTKVTFTGQGVGEGTALTIDAPSFVSPASTFQVKAQLADDFGNGVASTTAGSVKVTYTGPGIIFGTLPDKTDANGALQFSVLLGANDTGDISVAVSYDQNADSDFVDTKDLNTTKTITIGDAPAAQKVNAGSFKGYVAVYALGYEGQRLSAKIGNDWVIVDPIVNNESDNLFRVTDFTGAGVDIQVRIYIDRVLEATIPLTTK